LDAQRAAVATYLNGGDWSIAAEFTEVESGKNSDRPALDKARALYGGPTAACRRSWPVHGADDGFRCGARGRHDQQADEGRFGAG
jgi:hypothetical protein